MRQKHFRNRWLDVLRALAIVLVVNCHTANYFAEVNGRTTFLKILGLGGHGVDLFFVLSGWLLGSILLRELERTETIRLPNFYWRRWMRTLPAYYVVLAVTLLQAIVQAKFEPLELSYFAFLQTYVFDECPVFGVSWSLCVEEHFYLLIAPLLLWVGKSNSRGLSVLAILMLVPMGLRYAGLFDTLNQTHVRLDQCAAGVSLAFLHARFGAIWNRLLQFSWLLGLIAVALIAWAIGTRFGLGAEPPLAVFTLISCIAVLLSTQGEWWESQLNIPGAFYLATRSYSIYLLHIEAISLANRLDINSFWLYSAFVWTVSLVLAEVLYRCVEIPFMGLRDRKPAESALTR